MRLANHRAEGRQDGGNLKFATPGYVFTSAAASRAQLQCLYIGVAAIQAICAGLLASMAKAWRIAGGGWLL